MTDATPTHEVAVEQEDEGTARPGVSRGQNRVHVLPESWSAAATLLEPQLDRIDRAAAGTQLLIVAGDTDAASGIGVAVTPGVRARGLTVATATDTRRARRVLSGASPTVLVVQIDTAVALLQTAALKLESVRAVALAWLDADDERAMSALAALMAEVPKDAARVVFAAAESESLDALLERHARRAVREAAAQSELGPVSVSYVATSEGARIPALRQLLDALDPESAFVATSSPDSLERAQVLLHSMGYGPDDAIRAGRVPPDDARVVIFLDMPASADELRRPGASPNPPRIFAIVAPRQLDTLRRLSGSITPFTLPDAALRARAREDAMRDELRRVLADGRYARELLALEPLLADYDGTQVAAAALRLLEAERAKGTTASAGGSGSGAPASREERATSSAGPMTRLYLNVGEMDNVRPGDLVGAIVNEAGIARTDVGKVEVRDRHSTVEVATHVANSVVEKITGVSIRGRRVLARVDEKGDRGPERGGEGRERSDRHASGRSRSGGDRGDRGPRGGAGGRGGRGGRDRDGARRPDGERRPFPKRT